MINFNLVINDTIILIHDIIQKVKTRRRRRTGGGAGRRGWGIGGGGRRGEEGGCPACGGLGNLL